MTAANDLESLRSPMNDADRPSTKPELLAPLDNTTPRFVSGSLYSHVLIMTGTGTVGLMAIFIGDFANLLFLGLLRDTEILAAVGFATTLLFFALSASIGLSIGATAAVAPAIGARRYTEARQLSTSAHAIAVVASLGLILLAWPFLSDMLSALGARGRTLELARAYTEIVFVSTPLLAFAICAAGVLRSAGDPRRAMYVTLTAAAVNVVFDPILIFWAGLGYKGAAYAAVLSRVAMAAVAYWAITRPHDLLSAPTVSAIRRDAPRVLAVAVPAILTNIATPTANAFTTSVMARYGDGAIAAWTIFGRLVPVAFGTVFALTASIGPIIGQNLGARRFDRLNETVTVALQITAAFTLLAWLLLALSAPVIVSVFGVNGEAADLVYFFCRWLPPLFAFLGALFLANAVFNALRKPALATMFNWGRATIGTVPLVTLGGYLAGAPGVLTANLLGATLFGTLALLVCYRTIDALAREAQ